LGDVNDRVAWFYADVPARLIGYVLDAAFLSIAVFVGAVLISLLFGPVVTFDSAADPPVRVDAGLAIADACLATVVSATYFVFTWRRFGGSPGQLLLGMRIWVEDHGFPISTGQCFVRWLFIGLPMGVQAVAAVALPGKGDALLIVALLAWYVVLLVSTARSPVKQGLHDRAARTVVTKIALEASWAGAAHRNGGSRVR
jgi:uncharacterized RDD family membrane protein YckC